MAIETIYEAASGRSFDNCAFIGQRLDGEVGFQVHESESWVMTNRCQPGKAAGTVTTSSGYGSGRWYTGVWSAPSGLLYLVDGDGEMHINRSADVDADDYHTHWQREHLRASLFGVWGLDDERVWAWGERGVNNNVFFRRAGSGWIEMPAPPFQVTKVHGVDTCLIAVGRAGGIARWDGGAWTEERGSVAENLTSVFVASEDEVYATGDGGSLLEGSRHGWIKIADGPGPGTPLFAVAKWKDALWVGAGELGLLRRVATTNQLEIVKPKIRATAFDARWDLVITCFDKIAGSADGVAFRSAALDSLSKTRAGRALLDFA